MILLLMIKKNLNLKLVNFFLRTFSITFGSNMFLVLKIIKFHNVFLAKVIHFYVV